MLERLLKLAEVLAAEGDVEGLKALDRRLAGYIKREAHFVPVSGGKTPNPWRKNMDYDSWENSPYYGSINEFMKKFPGGIKDWIEWRKKNREERHKKWDINKRKAYVLHMLKKGELDYDDLSGEYEPTKEERELAEMPASNKEREKAFDLLIKNIEMIKEMADLSDEEVKAWLEKHYGQAGMAAEDWNPEEDPDGDLKDYYADQNTFSYEGEDAPKPDLNRWKSEWRAERYAKSVKPHTIKEWRIVKNDEGTNYLLQALHVVPESVHGWQPRGAEAQHAWHTVDKKPTKYSVPENYDTELEDVQFADDPEVEDTRPTLEETIGRITDPLKKFDLLQALVNKEILSYKYPQGGSAEEKQEHMRNLEQIDQQIQNIKEEFGVKEEIRFSADDENFTGYIGPIEKQTEENENYRKVIFTGKYAQLVLMSIKVGEEIGEEIHKDVDQFFRIESGEGKFVVNGEEKEVKDGDAVLIPAGTEHNVINASDTKPLQLYTIYSPPNHPEGTIEKTKGDEAGHEADDLNKSAHYVPEGGDDVAKFENEPHLYSGEMDKYKSIEDYLNKYHKGQDAKDAAFGAAKDFVRYWRQLLKKKGELRDGRTRIAGRIAVIESDLCV